MNGPATVSVVIPLYNGASVIKETIESVLAQTWTDREITVIDDGSTDGSAEIVKAFGARTRYYAFENGGVAKARNRGIALSRGRYIALLDHDDLWAPTKLAKQVAMLRARPEIGMVTTGIVHMNRYGQHLENFQTGPPSEFYQLFVKGFGPTPSAVMIRRSVIHQVGGFDERFGSAGLDDHEFWPRVAQQCEIVLIDEPLTYHRHGEDKPPQVELGHRILLNEALLQRFGHEDDKRRYLMKERAVYFADMGKWRLQQGDLGGRADLLSALRCCVREVWSWKAARRAMSRMVRSYFSFTTKRV
ncbi:MAG: glycosyltransferase family 2 protein [Nitrospirota bacterium]|nr:glycosyltransferase family 2 protein [Nitrospirota bacterium]